MRILASRIATAVVQIILAIAMILFSPMPAEWRAWWMAFWILILSINGFVLIRELYKRGRQTR